MKRSIIINTLSFKYLKHFAFSGILLLTVACDNFTNQTSLTEQKNIADTAVEAKPSEETLAKEDRENNDVEEKPSENRLTKEKEKKRKNTSSEYINSLLPEARRIEKEHGIPLDLTLAIAREESGNGDYIIGKGNHFGLRCASDDCITLEKHGQMINYETCPEVSECFDIFANTIIDLSGGKKITLRRLYRNGYATSPHWVRRVGRIRKEVRRTLKKANIEY